MGWTWRGGWAPRSAADTEGAVRRVLEKLEATDQDQLILRLVANSPTVFRPFVLLANALVNQATLPAADREVVVLHLAAAGGAHYEWEAHQEPAKHAGLSDEQRAVLGAGEAQQRPELFTANQLLALRLADALSAGRSLGDEDWRAAVAAWDEQGALDLVFSVAWWHGFVPTFTRALDLRRR